MRIWLLALGLAVTPVWPAQSAGTIHVVESTRPTAKVWMGDPRIFLSASVDRSITTHRAFSSHSPVTYLSPSTPASTPRPIRSSREGSRSALEIRTELDCIFRDRRRDRRDRAVFGSHWRSAVIVGGLGRMKPRSLPIGTASTRQRFRKWAGPTSSTAADRALLEGGGRETLAFADYRGNCQYHQHRQPRGRPPGLPVPHGLPSQSAA